MPNGTRTGFLELLVRAVEKAHAPNEGLKTCFDRCLNAYLSLVLILIYGFRTLQLNVRFLYKCRCAPVAQLAVPISHAQSGLLFPQVLHCATLPRHQASQNRKARLIGGRLALLAGGEFGHMRDLSSHGRVAMRMRSDGLHTGDAGGGHQALGYAGPGHQALVRRHLGPGHRLLGDRGGLGQQLRVLETRLVWCEGDCWCADWL